MRARKVEVLAQEARILEETQAEALSYGEAEKVRGGERKSPSRSRSQPGRETKGRRLHGDAM